MRYAAFSHQAGEISAVSFPASAGDLVRSITDGSVNVFLVCSTTTDFLACLKPSANSGSILNRAQINSANNTEGIFPRGRSKLPVIRYNTPQWWSVLWCIIHHQKASNFPLPLLCPPTLTPAPPPTVASDRPRPWPPRP